MIGDKQRNKVREMKLEVREEAAGEETRKVVRVTVSSENPCKEFVFDDERREWIRAYEVLGHTEAEIDRSRCADGLVIQDNHEGDQVGLIRNVELSDGKLGGVIEFCAGQRAQEIKSDAENGLRRNMSVGYMVDRWVKVAEGEAGDLPTYRAVRWTPYEASFVNVPADTQVGVGRELDITENGTAASTAATNERNQQMAEPVEIQAVAPAVDNGAELRALKDEVVSLREALKKPEMPEAKRAAQFDEADTKKIGREYNLMNAVRALAGVKVDCGFEREVSDEIAKKTGRTAQGFFIPECALVGRAFDKGTNAGNLVATDTLFGEMVPALVAQTVLGKAGVRTLTGLVGDISIPTAGSATAYWVSAEGGDATEQSPSIGQVTATPKTVGAYTDITRKLMNQSGISANAFIADALRSSIARAIEAASFGGTGTSGQPTGLDSLTSTRAINTITGFTTPTWAKVLEFISTIEGENAMGDTMKFVCRPEVWAKLASTIDYTTVSTGGETPTVAAAVSAQKYLLDATTNTMAGYDVIKANLATAKNLYFGDWSKLILAFWSGLDLTVDTNSLSKSGGVRLVALQDMDVVCTQPKAFAKGQAIA